MRRGNDNEDEREAMKGLSQMGVSVFSERWDLRERERRSTRTRTRNAGGNGVLWKNSKFEFDNVNGGILI